MRTKLRLDLKDVRKQIQDLEQLLKEDKSPENVEAHRKLVDYEKKLKEQYEKMTGLSVDQATSLQPKGVVAKKEPQKATISGLFALLGGLLISWGYYNTVLHSIEGFDPTDLLNWFLGTSGSVGNLTNFMASIIWETSFYFVIVPIGGGSVLVFLSGLLEKSRGKLFGLIEGVGFLISAGLFSYILYTAPDPATAAAFFFEMIWIFGILVAVTGVLLFIGSLGHPRVFRKFLGIVTGILFIYSGAQLYLLSEQAQIQTVHQWPFITMPIVIGAFLYGLVGLFKMFR